MCFFLRFSPYKAHIDIKLDADIQRLAVTAMVWVRAAASATQRRLMLVDFADNMDADLQKTALFLDEGRPAVAITGQFGNEVKEVLGKRNLSYCQNEFVN